MRLSSTMVRTVQWVMLGASAFLWPALLGGCASSAVIAAAGVTAGFGLAQGQAEGFINGELKAARLVTLEEGIRAVLETFEELQLQLRTERRGEHDAYFRAKTDGGPEFKIAVKFKSPVVTKFEIRIGVMGDQAVSRLVQSRIDAHLGILTPPLLPPEESPLVKPNAGEARNSGIPTEGIDALGW